MLDAREERELPARARAVAAGAATASAAAALLLEAVAAVHGLIATRLERYARLAAAGAAGRDEHLTTTAVSAAAAIHRRLARRAALGAARWRVHQSTAGVEFLLAGREQKFTSAFATTKCLIGGQGQNLSLTVTALLNDISVTTWAPYHCVGH